MKYEILKDEFIEFDGRKLYRIKALKDFHNVKEGEFGGYIESERNLLHEGDAWVPAPPAKRQSRKAISPYRKTA